MKFRHKAGAVTHGAGEPLDGPGSLAMSAARADTGTNTVPRPPHTTQLESQDKTPKGSLPVPPQKEQATFSKPPGRQPTSISFATAFCT